MPEPTRTRRVERLLLEVAEQRNGIALYVAAQAFGTGLIIDGEPKEWHCTNHLTHLALEGVLARAHVSRGFVAVSPARKIITAACHDRCPDDQSENRSSVITSACLRLTTMRF